MFVSHVGPPGILLRQGLTSSEGLLLPPLHTLSTETSRTSFYSGVDPLRGGSKGSGRRSGDRSFQVTCVSIGDLVRRPLESKKGTSEVLED